jgi:hypothetical protein
MLSQGRLRQPVGYVRDFGKRVHAICAFDPTERAWPTVPAKLDARPSKVAKENSDGNIRDRHGPEQEARRWRQPLQVAHDLRKLLGTVGST